MSKYDKEREALGIQTGASSPSSGSKYASERDYYKNIPANNARGAAEADESRQVSLSREPTPAPKPKVSIPVLDWINDKASSASNFLNRAAISAADTIGLGQVRNRLDDGPNYVSDIFKENAAPADTASEKAADIAGSLYGFIGPGTAAYGTAGRAAAAGLSRLAPNAPKLVQALTRGAGAGLGYGAAREGLDAAVGEEDKSALERLKGVGTDAALFAAGDGAFSLLGSGIKAARGVADRTANSLAENALRNSAENSRSSVGSPFAESAALNNPIARGYTENVGRTFGQSAARTIDNGVASPVAEVASPVSGSALKYAADREQLMREQPEPVMAPDAEVAPATVAETVAIPEPIQQPRDLPISQISPFGKGQKFTNPEDTRTYIVSKTDREPVDFKNAVDKFYEKSVDNLQRINQFDKQVESVTGKKLSPEERSYYLALNSRGADVVSNHILTERLVDPKGSVIGESLKDITKQIPKRAYTNFKDYLIAKHAETRMARGETVYDKRTNITPEKVAEKVAGYEQAYPQFKEISNQLYAWNDKLTKAWLVDTGIISPEMAAAWKEANPFWVPNKRYFSEIEKGRGRFGGAKGGFAGQNNPVKGYTPGGSERPIIDPFESLIEYTDKFVKTAKRNEVMQTLIRNLEKDPEALEGFAKLVDQNEFASQKSLSELNDALKNEGIEGLINKLDDNFELAYNKPAKQRIADKGNIITGLINGKPTAIEVTDPMLLDALTTLSPQAQNKVVEIARSVTNFMKLFTTGINPIFSLTRNIFRDIPQAYIFSKTTNNPFRFGVDLLDGIVSSFGNKELYQRYKALGGGHSSPVASDRNLLKQSKRELLPQQKSGLGLIPRAYGALENLSNIVESAPRLGEFKRITQAGSDDYASRVKGLYEANDITTNFKKKGSVVKDADAFYPYLNAAVQGLDKFARAVKDNPKALAAKSALAVTVPTLFLYALNYDNPEYEKLSNNVKDNFFLIPKSDGTFLKIPKSRELGVPFGSLLERVMRAWFEKDPESFKGFADTVRTAFVPPGASGVLNEGLPGIAQDTILGPLVELASNKNFAGSPIVPAYLEGVSPRNQFDANTSEVSKKIGDILNVSPKQIDHLISSYTGVIGQLGIPATNQGATLGSTLIKQVTADPVFSNDATRNFYEIKDKIDTSYNDAKLTGVVPPGYNDDVRKYLTKVAGDLSDVTKAIRAVDDLQLTPAQKKDKKRDLTELRNETARKAYQAVRSVQK